MLLKTLRFSLIRSAHPQETEKEQVKERVTFHESEKSVLEKKAGNLVNN